MDAHRYPAFFHRQRSRLLALLLICILAALGSTHAAASSPLANQSIQAGDSTWSYYEGAKNGPTLLLVHGFASSKEVWHALGETLTTRFHVIIPDLPGWGASTRIAQGNYDIDAQAARLDAFITALDIQGVTLVGHSMGGAIVGVYAAENPARVARLALIGSLGLSFAENDFIRTLTAGINPFIYDDRAGVERTARWVYLKPPALSDQQVDDAIAGNRAQRSFIESTLARIRIPSQWLALEPRLAQLTLPVLGVGCRQDKVIDISALDTLRNGLPTTQDTRLVTLEGCNHLPMIERPTETAQLLGDFILGTEAQTQRSTRQ